MGVILQAEGLVKSYQGVRVVDNLSFELHEGEIFCLLGPNGAGKSTSIAMLSSVLPSEGGQILFRGTKVGPRHRGYLQRLGVVPQELALYGALGARKNLDFFASLYGLRGKEKDRKIDEALAFAGLEDRAKEPVDNFSGGMKRRLNIACALTHSPDILVMDEPTVGIDPQSRHHILEAIRGLRDRGLAVVYTSHYMEEVEAIGDRIVILDHGKVVAQGTCDELKDGLGDVRRHRLEIDGDQPGLEEALYRVKGVSSVRVSGTSVDIETVRSVENLDALIQAVVGRGARIRALATVEASLEQVFLRLTGRSLRD